MHRTADSRVIWQLVMFGVPLIALFGFFNDVIAPDWPAWVLSPTLVFGFYGAVSRLDQGSVVRAIMWQIALAAIAFASIYNVFDVVIGPDWPLWLIAPVLVIAAWGGLFVLSAYADDN